MVLYLALLLLESLHGILTLRRLGTALIRADGFVDLGQAVLTVTLRFLLACELLAGHGLIEIAAPGVVGQCLGVLPHPHICEAEPIVGILELAVDVDRLLKRFRGFWILLRPHQPLCGQEEWTRPLPFSPRLAHRRPLRPTGLPQRRQLSAWRPPKKIPRGHIGPRGKV